MIGTRLWKQDEQSKWMGNPRWVEYDIRAETSRSWIVMPSNRTGSSEIDQKLYGIKIPKRHAEQELRVRGFLQSEEEVNRQKWYHRNRAKILRVAENASVDVLWKIAEAVGYTEDNT